MIDKVCSTCQIEIKILRVGIYAVEMAAWGPLAIHVCDLWHCPLCNFQIMLGFGKGPIHYAPKDDLIKEIKELVTRGEAVRLCFHTKIDRAAFGEQEILVTHGHGKTTTDT